MTTDLQMHFSPPGLACCALCKPRDIFRRVRRWSQFHLDFIPHCRCWQYEEMYIFCYNSCQSSISSPPFPVIYQTLQNSTSFPDPSQLQNGAFAECPRLVQAGLENLIKHEIADSTENSFFENYRFCWDIFGRRGRRTRCLIFLL